MLYLLNHLYTYKDSGLKAHTPNSTYKKLAVQCYQVIFTPKSPTSYSRKPLCEMEKINHGGH